METVKTLLESKASKFEAECKNLKTQFFALKKTSREEIDKASLEADSAKFESENAIKRERETFAKQMGLEKELEAAKDINRAQKRELEKLRGDFEQTLKMCEAYESKIASSARKEENVRLVIEENRQRLDEALLERDKTNLKAQQLEKLVDNL